jgi:hypothetical protein
MVRFLLLPTQTIDLDFNLAKNFAKYTVTSCSFNRRDLKVAYAGESINETYNWTTDFLEFFPMHQHAKNEDFRVTVPIGEQEFSALLNSTIAEMDRATPVGFGKYILIITNMELRLTIADAARLHQMLLHSNVQLKIMEMQDANRTAEDESNLNQVVEGHVGHMSELLTVEQYFAPCLTHQPPYGPWGDSNVRRDHPPWEDQNARRDHPPWGDPNARRDQLIQVLDERRDLFNNDGTKTWRELRNVE